MAKAQKSETVPKAMQTKFDSIVAITDEFAQQHLNDEYAQMIRFATAALCRKRPSPLEKGRDKTWACGITHAIGMVNFLSDSSQTPHISVKELYKAFGVSASTGQAKSKQVRDTLKMHQMDPNWSLPSRLDKNPMAWMISVNGFIMDARTAPRDVQEMALAKGLIPYIPGEKDPSTQAQTQTKKQDIKQTKQTKQTTDAIYVLSVAIVGGPVTETFRKQHPQIIRTIEIKGTQTLEKLHRVIFSAFDREEEHMYEFQVGGRGPNDPNAKRYGIKTPFDDEVPTGYVSKTTIESLNLSKDDIFGYWFDFGDDWWHQINVLDIKEPAPKGKYPKVTERIGASPPQYADFEEED